MPIIKLARGSENSIPANSLVSNVLMPDDKNKLFVADSNGSVQGVSDIYVGPTQPLANVKIWHDTSSNTIRHNTGVNWTEVVIKNEPVEQNFASFTEEIYYNLNPGVYTNELIILKSSFGSEILYSVDGSEPSMVYTAPIPMFTGILKAKILTEPKATISLDYHKSYILSYSIADDTGNNVVTVNVDVSLLSEPVYLYLNCTSDYSTLTQSNPAYFNISSPSYSNAGYEYIAPNYTPPWSTWNTRTEIDVFYSIILCNAAGELLDYFNIPIKRVLGHIGGAGGIPAIYDGEYLKCDSMAYDMLVIATHSSGTKVFRSIPEGESCNIYLQNFLTKIGTWDIQFAYDANDPKFYVETHDSIEVSINSFKPVTVWQGFMDGVITGLDTIVPGVTFTRGSSGGYYNNDVETIFDQLLSPLNTEWAFLGLGPNAHNTNFEAFNSSNHKQLNFAPWRIAHGTDAKQAEETPCVVWLKNVNIYLDFITTSWGLSGASYAYKRSNSLTMRKPRPPVRVFTGLGKEFIKTLQDDPNVVQDILTANVSISRLNSGGPIVNMAVESTFTKHTSPSTTRWAFADLVGNPAVVSANDYANLIFKAFNDAVDGNPPSMVDKQGVCFLTEDNIYFDVKFTYWGEGGSGEPGTFTYNRSILPVAFICNLQSGVYSDISSIVLAVSDGSEILYSIDGSEPSIVYTGPIPMFTGALKATTTTDTLVRNFVLDTSYAWYDISNISYWSTDVVAPDSTYNGTNYVNSAPGDDIAVFPVGTKGEGCSIVLQTVDQATYDTMTHWSKGNRFQYIRITCDGLPYETALVVQSNSKEYIIDTEAYSSGQVINCPWPNVEGFDGDFGKIEMNGGAITTVSKIEVYTNIPILESVGSNLPAGEYDSSNNIILTSSQGSEILYSIDGTIPSIVYTVPIPMFTGVLRAAVGSKSISINYVLNNNLKWIDVTDPFYWSTDVINNMAKGTDVGWYKTGIGTDIAFFPINTKGDGYNVILQTIDQATYDAMTHWSKGLRFNKIRVTCNELNPGIWLCNNAGTPIFDMTYTNGAIIDCVWPNEIGYNGDFGRLGLWGNLTTVFKIEVYTDSLIPEVLKYNLLAGEYGSSDNIILTSSQGSEILYSIDGTTPSIVYTAPISMFTGTLRASVGSTSISVNYVLNSSLNWVDITDPYYWDTRNVNAWSHANFTGNTWTPKINTISMTTPGTIDNLGTGYVVMDDPTYASSHDWVKGLRFTGIRANFDTGDAYGVMPRLITRGNVEISSAGAVTEGIASGKCYPVTWPNGTGNANDLGTFILACEGGIVASLTKLEILTAQTVETPIYYWKISANSMTFDSPDFANQIDSISPTVSLTRGGTGQLYNTLQESAFVQNVSPIGAKFAFSALGPNATIPDITCALLEAGTITPVFTDIRTANANNSAGMVNKNAVMYLVAENTYVDIKITRWSPTAGTGGFTYERAKNTVTVIVVDGGNSNYFTINGAIYTPGTYELPKGEYTFAHVGTFPNGTNYSYVSYSLDNITSYAIAGSSLLSGGVAVNSYVLTQTVWITYGCILN
jgi:hypothetical protein